MLPRRATLVPKTSILFLLTVVLATPALSSTKGERVFRPGRLDPNLNPVQTVLMNDGKYALVDGASVSDRSKDKSVEVTCPTDMKAMSAGFSAASGRGEPPDFRVILSQASDKGTSRVVYAMFDGSGNVSPSGVFGVPAPYEWTLRVRLVCAKLG